MKKVIFLLFIVSVLGLAQAPKAVIDKWYLIGNSTQGDTFSATLGSRNTAGAVLGNYSRLEARVVSNDSTHLYLAIDRKLTSTWAALDSVLIHPTSGAGADTVWTLRNNTVEKLAAIGAEYRFRFTFLAGNASQEQTTKPRITLYFNGVK